MCRRRGKPRQAALNPNEHSRDGLFKLEAEMGDKVKFRTSFKARHRG